MAGEAAGGGGVAGRWCRGGGGAGRGDCNLAWREIHASMHSRRKECLHGSTRSSSPSSYSDRQIAHDSPTSGPPSRASPIAVAAWQGERGPELPSGRRRAARCGCGGSSPGAVPKVRGRAPLPPSKERSCRGASWSLWYRYFATRISASLGNDENCINGAMPCAAARAGTRAQRKVRWKVRCLLSAHDAWRFVSRPTSATGIATRRRLFLSRRAHQSAREPVEKRR